MKVFVFSQERTPLMPTTPRRARLWLKHKRARVIRHTPFTIQLRFPTTTYTQTVSVGVDTGSQTVGVAAVTKGKAVYQAEVQLRTDISRRLLQRTQILELPKSHTNDAIAIACEIGAGVKSSSAIYQMRCVPHGNYQLFNGERSEHRVWAPKRVRGWKLYELVEAKGQIGYIGGRRVKGAFVIKDVATGKRLLEITPRKLRRLARARHSWIIAEQRCGRKEEHASSPVF
jgi:hypothetical protein